MNFQDPKTYELQILVDLPFYTEGPAVDQAGNYYFTTLAGASILKLSPDGILSTWAQSPCPNGQIILTNGDHLVCDSKLGCIVRFDSNGTFVKHETPSIIDGVKVQVPNDLVVDQQGNLYFTDSVRTNGRIFFIGVDGSTKIIAEGLDYPNGIEISQDQKTLFVAESYKNRILKFALAAAGIVANAYTVFAQLPTHISGDKIHNLPDGISLHKNGMMAVAHYGMQAAYLLSPNGQVERIFDTTLPNTSNLVFVDDHTLLVTGGFGEPGPGAVIKIKF